MFHIGVLAPNPTSAARFLSHMDQVADGGGETAPQPDVTVSCVSMSDHPTAWQRGDLETARSRLVLSSARLRNAGAHFLVCTDDSLQSLLFTPGPKLAVPALDVSALVAAEAQRRGFAQMALLGTRWTLNASAYEAHLSSRGMKLMRLGLRDETTLHSIVFDELARGRQVLESREWLLSLLDQLRTEGCEAAILACPGLDLVVTPAIAPIPLLDIYSIVASAAQAVARGYGSFPTWAGGPYSPSQHPVPACAQVIA